MRISFGALLALLIVACAYDWDQFDPRLTGAGGSGAVDAQGGEAGAPGGGGSGADGGAGGGDGRRRRLLTLAPTNETFFEFPLLVVLDATRIDYAATQDAGQDLSFRAADETTVLSHEIELWDEALLSFVWVKVPSYLSGTAIWMYYGDPNASDGQNAADVWSNGYVAVWHMNGPVLDSTIFNNHGLVGGTEDAIGRIGVGQRYAQAGDHIAVPATVSLADLYLVGGTVEAWINPVTSGFGDPNGRIVDKSLDINAEGGWTFELATNTFSFEAGFATGSCDWNAPPNAIVFGAWQHIGGVYTGTTAAPALYRDGVALLVTTVTAGTGLIDTDDATALSIGNRPGGSDRTFDGIIDEVRLAKAPRTAGWMAAQHASMTDALVTYGPEEPAP